MSKKADKPPTPTESATPSSAPSKVATGKFLWLDPEQIKIVGLDCPVTPELAHLHDPDRTNLERVTEERIANYRALGVRTPVQLELIDGVYYAVDGRGRIMGARAVKAAQLKDGETDTIKVPGIVARGTAEDLFGLSRALNLHDVDSTLTNAKNAQRYLDMGATVGKVANRFGVTEQTIRNWQSMLAVAPEVIAHVKDGDLTPTAAMALATLPREEQKEVAAELVQEQRDTGKKATVSKAKEKAAERKGTPAPASTNTPKAKLDKLETLLTKLSGADKKELTKDRLAAEIDRICRIVTGHTLEKLGDIGD